MTLSFNPAAIIQHLEKGDSLTVAHEILALLRHFEGEKITEKSEGLSTLLTLASKICLHAIASEKFAIPHDLAPEFIRRNIVLANMAYVSGIESTDLFIKSVSNQPGNISKILTLYSVFSQLELDIGALFQADRYLASLWVSAILKGHWKANAAVDRFLKRLLDDPALKQFDLSDPAYPLAEDTSFAYFDITYASWAKERAFRDIINAQVQQDFRYAYHHDTPDFKRILVVSAFFYKSHPVYRCLAPLIASLRPQYHVSLFYLGVEHQEQLDHDLFDEVYTTGAESYAAHFTYEMLENILAKNFGILILADVGLSRPSLILANLRLAPIQITTYGHPVTSGKTQIDYFIGGTEVEPAEHPQKHFEEKLVLMPGLGVEPVRNTYTPTFSAVPEEPVEIGLSWGEMKFTYPHVLRLKRIQERCKKRIRFNVLGISATRLTYLVVKKDLEALFGPDNVHITPTFSSHDYMQSMEACHLLLDSHHFGSYTRVIDSLVCKKPLIALEGEKSYQRFASAMLRQCGLDDLIATSEEEFIALTLRLIEDTSFKEAIASKLDRLDMEKSIYNTGNARYFRNAIDAIVADHTLGARNKDPIIVKETLQ